MFDAGGCACDAWDQELLDARTVLVIDRAQQIG
jgi:hypothetical protein